MTRYGLVTLALLCVALLLGTPRLAQAAESYGNCAGFITTLPTTINAPGTWCFNQNLSSSATTGTAIVISSDNVTLDCNDFKLDGLAAGANTAASGIGVSNSFNNITVRHCNIRGFFVGLSVSGAGHLVEDNRFDGITGIAMDVEGDGSVVRRNRIFDTGGSTINAVARGISSFFNVDIIDNTISGVVAGSGTNQDAIGIRTSNNTSGSVQGNRVRGLVKNGSGVAYGVLNFLSDRVVLRDNDLVGDGNAGSFGLACSNANGRARDNMIKGFGTGISGCSNDGGNAVKP
jgi:hypothetical protein